jgi:hypothetical protein
MKKINRSILVIVIGAVTMYQFIKQADHWTILDMFIDIILGIVTIGCFTWVIYKDWKEYKSNTSESIYKPSLMVGIFTISFIAAEIILSLRDNSPVMLTADNIDDLSSASIDFRKDGTYKLSGYSVFTIDLFRGNYAIKDSIIALDKSDIDGIIKSNRLAIKTDDSGRDKRKIYQLDAQNNVLTNAPIFFISNKQTSK